jgi:hypothetical protein
MKRVQEINHQENGESTRALVTYLGTPLQSIQIHYTFSGETYDMKYYKTFAGGNVLEDAAFTSNHNSELGKYDFDDNINPYYFLNWPDLFLTHQNKNNITRQYKTYQGSYPVAEPYRSEYTYDADGYPKEVIRHYRSFPGGIGTHAYTTKTIFQYR